MNRLFKLSAVVGLALSLAACDVAQNGSGGVGSLAAPTSSGFHSGNIDEVVSVLKGLGSAENDASFSTPIISAYAQDIVYFVDFSQCNSNDLACKRYVVNTFWEPSELGRTRFSSTEASKWSSANRGGKVYVDSDGDLVLEVAATGKAGDSKSAVRGVVQRFLRLAKKIEKDFQG